MTTVKKEKALATEAEAKKMAKAEKKENLDSMTEKKRNMENSRILRKARKKNRAEIAEKQVRYLKRQLAKAKKVN